MGKQSPSRYIFQGRCPESYPFREYYKGDKKTMSTLFYDIPLKEEYENKDRYQERIISKEHFEKVKDWLPKEFEKCRIHEAFDGILKNRVQSCTIKCLYTKKKNQGSIPIARITIEFVPGFRLNREKRQACWDQMEDQMTDGFGEMYDKAEIPDADGWQLKF